MNIIYDYPPNYDAIAKAFNIKDNQAVIFTYGNSLYVPGGERIVIDKPLMRHEETHARQQRDMGAEEWWEQFLADPDFRFKQELEAYRNQYKAMAGMEIKNRIDYLDFIAGDLASEIYGNIVTKEEAFNAITEGIALKSPTKQGKHRGIRYKLRKRERQNRRKGRR